MGLEGENTDLAEERDMWQGECETLQEQVEFLKQSLMETGHDDYQEYRAVTHLPRNPQTVLGSRGYRREGVDHKQPPLPSWQGEAIPRRRSSTSGGGLSWAR